MEFKLVYEGFLPPSGNNTKRWPEKHAIRKEFHLQLKELWKQNPYLAAMQTDMDLEVFTDFGYEHAQAFSVDKSHNFRERLAKNFSNCGFRFVPLVNKYLDLACGLDIVFLRRENPGAVLTQEGDIDNRLKTLIDALRMPAGCLEIDGFKPEDGEDPFYCLLESDTLVTDLKVTTDRLLTPAGEGRLSKEVVLIINVTIKVLRVSEGNMAFL